MEFRPRKKSLNPVLQKLLARLEVEEKDTQEDMLKELKDKQKRTTQMVRSLERGLNVLKAKKANDEDPDAAFLKQDTPQNLAMRKYLLKKVRLILKT